MALSKKAQAIYQRLVDTNTVNDWVGFAKDYITRKGQYEAGPDYKYDVEGFQEDLKADLSDASEDASNDNWEEIARMLLEMATPK
jgi:hypothetical protein